MYLATLVQLKNFAAAAAAAVPFIRRNRLRQRRFLPRQCSYVASGIPGCRIACCTMMIDDQSFVEGRWSEGSYIGQDKEDSVRSNRE